MAWLATNAAALVHKGYCLFLLVLDDDDGFVETRGLTVVCGELCGTCHVCAMGGNASIAGNPDLSRKDYIADKASDQH